MKILLKQLLLRFIFTAMLIGLTLAYRPSIVSGGRTMAMQAPSCTTGTSLMGIRQFTASAVVRAIALGDFNRDGKVDLAVSEIIQNIPVSKISLWFGDGLGNFENVTKFEAQGAFVDLDVGDLNGDGKVDLVGTGGAVFGPDGGAVALLGNGDGTFTASNGITTAPGVGVTVVADFNGDGRADVAVANQFGGNVSVSMASADGRLGAPTRYALMIAPTTIAAADFTGDGKADLVTANNNSPELTLLVNNGSGGFSVTSGPDTGGSNNAIAAGDFNGDGKRDLALVRTSSVVIVAGDGQGGFGASKSVSAKGGSAILASDFNGDGKDDLAVGDSAVTLLLNDGEGNFNAMSFGTGQSPTTLVAGDFNGDGKMDLAASGPQSDKVSILLNAGGGILQSPVVTDPPIFPSTFNLSDLNKDGKPDLIVTRNLSFATAFGDGSGGFGTPRVFDSLLNFSSPVAAVQVADFNKDGNPDLVFAGDGMPGGGTGAVIFAFGDGSANFNATRIKKVTVGTQPADMLAADVNADGALDLVVANAGSNDLSILLGNGQGDFVAAQAVPAGLEPRSLAVADFNSDGKLDLAVANRNSVVLSILLGNGQGGFNAMPLGLAANPREVETGDFNADGKADLIVTQNNAGFVSVLLGDGNGGFGIPININVGGVIYALALADLNGDGKMDFAVTRFIGNSNTESRVQIYAGNGAGSFNASSELSVPMVRQLGIADLNGDGVPDLALVSLPLSGGGQVWSILAQCNPPPSNTLTSVSAASFRRLFLASESIVAAFGVGLSTEPSKASTVPLPTQLAGTSARVKDSAGVERLAPLFFVSPNQVNYLMPAGTAIGTATVTITPANGNTVSGTTQIAAVAPGLFTANSNGQGAPAGVLLRVQGDGQQVFLPLARFDSVSNQIVPVPINLSVLGPTLDRVFLILFGTGMRGGAGTKVELMIGERKFDVLYAGPQGDFVGVDQINVEILRGFLPFGDYDVTVTVNGRVANPVRIILAN